MKKDRALVRSIVVRALTADEAKINVVISAPSNTTRFIIRAYRFYKKLTAEPKKKTYLTLDELLPAKRVLEVIDTIERVKTQQANPIIIRPEDLPQDHPDHVCTDKCYDIVEIDPSKDTSDCSAGRPAPMPESVAMEAVREIRQILDDPKAERDYQYVAPTPGRPVNEPCRWHGDKYLGPDGQCLVPNTAYYKDQAAAAAAKMPGPYTFPDKPVIPTQPAVFDDLSFFGLNVDANVPDEAVGQIDIEAAAPVIHPPCDCPGCTKIEQTAFTVGTDFKAEEVVEDVVKKGKGAVIAVIAAIVAMLGCGYLYLHYFVK